MKSRGYGVYKCSACREMKGAVRSRTQIHLPARMLKNNERKVTTRLSAGSRRLTDRGNVYRIFERRYCKSIGPRFLGASTWKIVAT